MRIERWLGELCSVVPERGCQAAQVQPQLGQGCHLRAPHRRNAGRDRLGLTLTDPRARTRGTHGSGPCVPQLAGLLQLEARRWNPVGPIRYSNGRDLARVDLPHHRAGADVQLEGNVSWRQKGLGLHPMLSVRHRQRSCIRLRSRVLARAAPSAVDEQCQSFSRRRRLILAGLG